MVMLYPDEWISDQSLSKLVCAVKGRPGYQALMSEVLVKRDEILQLAEAGWISDEVTVHRLAAASKSFEPYDIHVDPIVVIRCYPRSPESNDTFDLLVLQVIREGARKNDVFVEVYDDNGALVMEGEIVDGELTNGISDISQFTTPFRIKLTFFSK